MHIEELLPGINLEDKSTEFKGIILDGKKENGSSADIGWLKTIASFANTEGGCLYVGVKDKSHEVVALDHTTADKIILMIHRRIREKITPGIAYDVDAIPVSNGNSTRYIIRVTVQKNKELPVTLHENGLLGIYVRNFGQTETATPEQIREMVLMSEQIPYDQPFTENRYEKKDFTQLFRLARERGVVITDKQLMSIGFMNAEGMLSKGALLFKDSCDSLDTQLVAALWPEYTKGSDVVLAHMELTGNLLSVLSSATEFVMNHSTNGYNKEADTRVNYFAYPARSVTEGIVNAIGHRNYFIKGTQVEINIFRDRMEITSPGSLLGVRRLQKEKDIASIIPRRRNEVICAVLEMCRYMEKKGSGFDKIEEDYRSYDEAYKPYVSADGQSFTLTLPDLTYQAAAVSDAAEDIPEIYAEALVTGKNDMKILAYCYNKQHSVRDIAEYIGVRPSTYFRKNTIARLADAGLLIEKDGARAAEFQANHTLVRRKGIY